MKKIFLLLGLSAMMFSCKKDDDKKDNVYKGAVVQFHDGKAWTWAKINKSGAPEQVAITLNDALLKSVPVGGEGGHNHENNIVLPLHPKAIESTLFKHVGLDWAPAGHEPNNVYTLPHFDFHYYMMTEAERLAATDQNKILNKPAAEYIPANHVDGAPIPQMGLHWLDVTSPEFQGKPFTQTFIYGSYDGKVTFLEPMITLQFLKQTNNFERPIPQPQKYQKSGYYPTKMRVVKHDGVTDIILDGFVKRQAS